VKTEVGARVRDHTGARVDQCRALTLVQPDAMGNEEPEGKEADVSERVHATRCAATPTELALIPSFEQVHVDGHIARLRDTGNMLKQRLGAPRWPRRTIDNVDVAE
jgi:hypothetical protein